MRVLMPLPAEGFDPTEAAVPWKVLRNSGVEIVFATQSGAKPSCDLRMLTGQDLGWLGFLLKANALGRQAYLEMSESPAFLNPIQWNEIASSQFEALLLPGGHAQGMKEYLESQKLQKTLVEFVTEKKPVGAICHGVVLAARSLMLTGQSVLYGKKVTSLLASQELTAWYLTKRRLGNYYRTYPTTVEDEVRGVLERKADFIKGPLPVLRDSPQNLDSGFCVRDGLFLTARWPGDSHRFSSEFTKILKTPELPCPA